jgi:single-stranded-DNA-specific exonuclease
MKLMPVFERDAKNNSVVHQNTLLNRIYQNRGVSSPNEINYSLNNLLSPDLMKGMDDATDVIINHIMSNSKIIIVGDYDCDGCTATSTAVEGLRLLGAKNVSFIVPDRVKHGYGLTPAIANLVGEERPDLIITVDNGISSIAGAEEIKKFNYPCQLVITDHHLPSKEGLPDADAIVNPNQDGCTFPSKSIAGCGVMFYTIIATRKKMREQNIFEKLNMREPSVMQLIDLVALGTVADVVTLDYNNRILVSAGLKHINEGRGRPGLVSLLEKKGKIIGSIVSSDFGFAAGPCLNAAGRLDDMSIGIKCLLEHNELIASEIASQLVSLNETRKEIELGMVEEAIDFVDNFTTDRFGVCLHGKDWHEGVVGIVASRIKERLNRPVLCFADTHGAEACRSRLKAAVENLDSHAVVEALKADLGNADIKASARSVPGIHLKHILDEISTNYPKMLAKNRFGGHAMAAGITIQLKDYNQFQDIFDMYIRRELTQEMINGRIDVDIKNLPAELITMENAEMLKKEGPWGQNFPKPVFSGEFHILETRILKDKHLKLRLSSKTSNHQFDAIAFNCVENGVLPVKNSLEASFSMDINEFRGNKTLQLMIDHLQDDQLSRELMADINMNNKPECSAVKINGAAKNQKDNPVMESCI